MLWRRSLLTSRPPARPKVIGEGTQGKVREALHSETLQRVAIKIIALRSVRRTRLGEEALKEEIKIHRKLKHRHVVELLGEFRRPEKDKWYIVLELVPGTSLQDLADEGREALLGAVFESSLNRL